jgi:hypothetical protein
MHFLLAERLLLKQTLRYRQRTGFLSMKMHQANPTLITIHLIGGGFKPLRLVNFRNPLVEVSVESAISSKEVSLQGVVFRLILLLSPDIVPWFKLDYNTCDKKGGGGSWELGASK